MEREGREERGGRGGEMRGREKGRWSKEGGRRLELLERVLTTFISHIHNLDIFDLIS